MFTCSTTPVYGDGSEGGREGGREKKRDLGGREIGRKGERAREKERGHFHNEKIPLFILQKTELFVSKYLASWNCLLPVLSGVTNHDQFRGVALSTTYK